LNQDLHRVKALEIFSNPKLDGKGRKKGSRDLINDLFFHAIEGEMAEFLYEQLTDFHFIGVVYRMKSGSSLLNYYNKVMTADFMTEMQKHDLREFYEFLRKNYHIFDLNCLWFNEDQIIQEALNWSENSLPYLRAIEWVRHHDGPAFEWIRDENKRQLHHPCYQLIHKGSPAADYEFIHHGQYVVLFGDHFLQITNTDTGADLFSVFDARAYRITADQQHLVIQLGKENKIRVVDLPFGHMVAEFTTPNLNHFEICPTGDRLFLTEEDESIKILEFPSGKEIKSCHMKGTLEGISKDGQLLILLDLEHRQIVMYDPYQDEAIRCFEYEDNNYRHFINNDQFLVYQNDSILIYNLTTRSEHILPIQPETLPTRWDNIYSFTNEQKVALRRSFFQLQIWDIQEGKLLSKIEDPAGIDSYYFSPGEQIVLTTTAEGILTSWRVETGEKITSATCLNEGFTFFDQGRKIISSTNEGQMIIRDADTLEVLRSIFANQVIASIHASDKLGKIMTISYDEGTEVRVWKTTTLLQHGHDQRRRVAWKKGQSTDYISNVKLSSDGKKVMFYRTFSNTFEVWQLETFSRLYSEKCAEDFFPTTPFYSFSPNSNWFGVSTQKDRVQLTNAIMMDGKALPLKEGTITDLHFSPDHRSIATATSNGIIVIWDVQIQGKHRILTGHASEVQCCSFSYDGALLASASKDQDIKVWDLRLEDEAVVTLQVEHSGIQSLAFSNRGEYLLLVCSNGKVICWESRDWTIRWETRVKTYGNDSIAKEIIISPDDQKIAILTYREDYDEYVYGNNADYFIGYDAHVLSAMSGELLIESECELGGKQPLFSLDSTYIATVQARSSSSQLDYEYIKIKNLETNQEMQFWCNGKIKAFQWKPTNQLVVMNEFGEVIPLSIVTNEYRESLLENSVSIERNYEFRNRKLVDEELDEDWDLWDDEELDEDYDLWDDEELEEDLDLPDDELEEELDFDE
jgi:WD40 repeat protein